MTSLLTGNTFNPDKDIPNIPGKVFVITGGTAGIGFGIAAHILQHGPEKLYLLGKKEEHGEEALKKLQDYGDTARVEFIRCEVSIEDKFAQAVRQKLTVIKLEDLKQTDEVAKSLVEKLQRLDALILNAGIGVGKYAETKDGIDSHMQVNIFAQAHLAMTLLPILEKTSNSRLVLQSSELHRGGPSDTKFASIAEMNQDIGPAYLYNRSKLAQILFVRQLVSRMQKGTLKNAATSSPQLAGRQGPWINATHPGGVSTDQPKQAEEAYGTLGKIGVAVTRPFMKNPVDDGCRPALFAATSEDIVAEKVQGQYIVPDRKVSSPSSQALDDRLAESLWNLTFEVIESKLGRQAYL